MRNSVTIPTVPFFATQNAAQRPMNESTSRDQASYKPILAAPHPGL